VLCVTLYVVYSCPSAEPFLLVTLPVVIASCSFASAPAMAFSALSVKSNAAPSSPARFKVRQ
jgi:hypothetical protein